MPPRRLDESTLPNDSPLGRRLAARGPLAPVEIVHDGAALTALSGEPLALSLAAHGRTALSRSPKYHRPRGPMCLRGHCEGCLLRVDGEPNVMACRTAVHPGLVATSQNAFPSARVDVFRVTDWFFPKHLDHHHLMVGLGATLNRTMQSVARKMAGLGTLPDDPEPCLPATVTHVDALVVGAGSSGVAAANALARAGLRVLCCDGEAAPGGLRRDDPNDDLADLEPLDARVQFVASSMAVATYDHGTLLAEGQALRLVHARARVFACGTVDSVGTFVHNDLPGIYTARGFARALCHGVLLADRVALVGPTPGAPALGPLLATLGLRRLHTHPEATVAEALGSSALQGAILQVGGETVKVRPLDALVVGGEPASAYELAGQAGADTRWDARRRCFVPATEPDGSTAAPGVFATGSLRLGGVAPAVRRADGRAVAMTVIAHLHAP